MELRPIPNIDGYAASPDGHIWNIRRATPNRLSEHISNTGYPAVGIRMPNGKKIATNVHRLVCAAFHGVGESGMEVRHLDGTRTNNDASNLSWGTRKDNAADTVRHGRSLRGSRCPHNALSNKDVLLAAGMLRRGETYEGIAAKFGVTAGTIFAIDTGKTWSWLVRAEQYPIRANRGCVGTSHHACKLSENDVREIKRMAASGGTSNGAIARRFGVTRETIRAIITGRTWKHLN